MCLWFMWSVLLALFVFVVDVIVAGCVVVIVVIDRYGLVVGVVCVVADV